MEERVSHIVSMNINNKIIYFNMEPLGEYKHKIEKYDYTKRRLL